ncbi:MAG: ATPase, partial [Bacteroidia bacterium]|nr:ATPase [Bacteroidia bacterium]
DILGAARATCQKEKGIVGILGTGSNACVYNGLTITQTAPSYGYLFGDYGSGANIGKMFVQCYCDNTLPKELKTEFEKEGYNADKILEGIYKNPMPSRFLASIFPFVLKHKQHPFVTDIIKTSLKKYIEIQVLPIVTEVYPMYLVGSVAVALQNEIKTIAQQFHLEVRKIAKNPIHGLIEYHQKH